MSYKKDVAGKDTISVLLSRASTVMIILIQREKQIDYASYKRRYDLE